MNNKKEFFREFDRHLLEDESPSEYFNRLIREGDFPDEYPYTMLSKLIDIPQSPQHHPEGSVWNHTMMVVDNAAKRKHHSENPRVFMWSALLHDIGKGPTTKRRNGRLTSYDHDKWSRRMAVDFLKEFTDDEEFIKKVSQMVRWHMQILYVTKNLPFAEVDRMITEVSISEIALLSLCDRLGRGEMTEDRIREEGENVKRFIEKCKSRLK